LSTQLYPEVKDATSLGPRYAQTLYLPFGIEGQADAAGTASVGALAKISRPADADTFFGPASSLSALVKFVLNRGIPQVTAVASAKASGPTLVQRQAAWALLEADPSIRIRLTDSVVQADHVALADSCEWAEGINNKQVCFVGMASGTSSAALVTAAAAIASKRAVLVGPGVYDETGTLRSGSYAAASVAAEVSKNPDITDDLDTARIPGFTGLEVESPSGLPVFRLRAGAGTPVNDFETMLQGGVSPLKQSPQGGVEITHLRTTYVTDTTYDALMTRLIVDQLFIDVRDYVRDNLFLRRGNTQKTRDDLRAGVAALLNERSGWLLPVTQPDGNPGYAVAVTSSTDGRQVTVSYKGQVVRGIQTILVDAQLVIPV
jgi:hypothetical protein